MCRLLFLLSAFFFATALFPAPKREMRGVWIATVSNIDWPTNKGNVEAQKKEMLRMLDSLAANHINTVIFQARPCSDAFYQSDIEPWSAYLTGEQGKSPS
ncbi:MAG: family 10 glycosylhydrolase, partial [Paludibacteraceae bacterium]